MTMEPLEEIARRARGVTVCSECQLTQEDDGQEVHSETCSRFVASSAYRGAELYFAAKDVLELAMDLKDPLGLRRGDFPAEAVARLSRALGNLPAPCPGCWGTGLITLPEPGYPRVACNSCGGTGR